ncbi:MAG TPA: VWA domain-containing protein [Planctomycetota bacterium]
MTSLLFAAPVALAALWLASRANGAELSRGRRAVSTTLRSLAVLLLGAALARPDVQRPGERPWLTVFVADVSDSVPAAAWSAAIPELRRAWSREIADGNRCALVAFAGRAETLVAPTSSALEIEPWRLAHRTALVEAEGNAARATEIQQWRDRLQVNETDPGEGTRAARALFQESSASRLVLLTDGRLPAEAPLPAGAALVALEAGPRRDLAVIDVQAPTAVRAGEPFDVRVSVDATAPMEATLTLSLDNRPVPAASRKVAIPRGRGVVLLANVQQPAGLAPGLHPLKVVASAPGDDEPGNNSAAAAFATTGKPRVLLIEGRPREGEFLARVFEKQDIDFTRDAPAAAAERAGVLDEFAAVILAGVPRADVPLEFQKALVTYVERSGGGLWLLGSPTLAGPSGWAKSELERLLPVTFLETAAGSSPKPSPEKPPDKPPPPAPPTEADPPGEIKRVLAPAAAVLFVVDRSGSMAGPPIEIVKRSCVQSAKTLSPRDLMAVIAFDRDPDWILEFTEGDRHEYIESRVSRLMAGGFTSIYPALAEARRAFRADPRARRCSAKHVILLSDGDTSPGDFETLVREMRADGIAVTAVCVGSAPKFDAPLMSQIADWGGGRFIFTHSFKDVPKVFLQEVKQILGPINALRAAPPAADPIAKPDPKPTPVPDPAPAPAPPAARLAVVAKDAHDALQGVDTATLPGLYGRLDAQARPAASVAVPLAFSDGKPLLAVGRAGLGRTAVWTSDLASPWSREWHAWKDAGKLAAQVVRSLSAAPPDEDLAARSRVVIRGRTARVRVDPGAPGESLSAYQGDAALPLTRDPDGGSSLELTLDQADQLVRVTLRRGSDGPTAVLGAMRTAEAEFLPTPPFPGGAKATDWPGLERELSRARLSADRKIDLSPWLVGFAALLLAIDVAVRRYSA